MFRQEPEALRLWSPTESQRIGDCGLKLVADRRAGHAAVDCCYRR